jgi:hypothetical protein
MRALIVRLIEWLVGWKDPTQTNRNNLMRAVLTKEPLPPPRRTQ